LQFYFEKFKPTAVIQ